MNRLVKYSFLLLLILFFSLNAQSHSKWRLAFGDSLKTIYVDTTSVRIGESQIICWVLETFKNGVKIKSVPEKVFKQKEQIVFNIPRKHFNVLGALYYNKIRLVGDSYSQNLIGSGGIFSKPIDSDSIVKKIYEFLSKNYLETSFVAVEPKNRDSTKSRFAKSSIEESTRIAVENKARENHQKPTEEDSTMSLKTRALENAGSLKVNNSKALGSLRKSKEKTASPKTETKPELKIFSEEKPVINYNRKRERNITRTIFTDGTLYVVQVSSWRRKKFAVRQVNKLKKLGYNAFIVRAYIRKYHGYWNRVRVGYFTSLKEAKKVQRELKRRL